MKLNVLLITYNHEKFIADSLNSILFQKTNFKFNIIVADDKSTDNTINIIKNIQSSTDIEFIYLETEKNLGITKNYKRAFNACNAEYVAVMEGDDLWTDPYRLQKHIDFLEHHWECEMSFNRYSVSNFEKCEFHLQPHWAPIEGYQLITSRDIAKDNIIGNFSTCIYRKSALQKLPSNMFEITAYDWITNIMIGRNGYIGYIAEPMNIYRIHSKGVWSGKKESENISNTLKNIDIYMEITNHLFDKEFIEFKSRLQANQIISKPVEIIQSQTVVGLKAKLKIIKDYMPPVFIWILKAIIPTKIWSKIVGR